MPRMSSGKMLLVLAWANACLHLSGLMFAYFGMKPGTPLAPLPDRMEYLAASSLGWTLGWVCWMACAIFFILFMATVVKHLGPNADLARFGLMIAVAGAAFDLFCDSIYIIILPMIASWRPSSESHFLVVERATGIGSMVIANGAYSVAILLLSATLRDRLTAGLGYVVGACGLLLAAAGFTGVPWHAEWATPPTIGLFCVWVILVAHSLRPNRRPP